MVSQFRFKSLVALTFLAFYGSAGCHAAPVSKAKERKSAASSASSLLLAEKGQAKYVVALAQDAIPAERTAAADLVNYLQQISGAQFVVKNENEVPDSAPQILVGAGARTRRLLPLQRWEALGTDGIVIKTQGTKLILAGGRPRGTLYAVHSFLEDTLGVHWWTAEDSTVPRQSTIRIKPHNITYVPQISTREATYTDVQNDPVFATRLKINGHWEKQGPELGGHNTNLGWCHTFANLLPVEKYFKDHPEWYADPSTGLPCTPQTPLLGHDTWQLCLTNEAARRELTNNAIELLRKNPDARMISVSQNDYPHPCRCPADLALQQKEGSPSGPLLHFVNAVAADIEKEFPGVLVETLAYQHTRKPPQFVKPRGNVVVRLCSIEADFARPFTDDSNADFRDDVLGWKAIAPRLYFWDYVANFANMNVPHPNMPVLGANVRFMAENNAISVFEQGDAESNRTGDFTVLRAWLLSHLLWNPRLDQKALENEFLRGYYGAAAPFLRSYLDTVQGSFLATQGKGKLGAFQSEYSYLTLDVMNKATLLFRQAEAAVKSDAALLARVRRERLSLDNAWLLRYRLLQREARERKARFEGPADPAVAAAEFLKLAKEYKLESMRLNAAMTPVDEYAEKLLQRFQPAAPLPAVALGKAENDVIDAQENAFRISNQDNWAEFADDSKASNGRTVRMRGDHSSWAVQYVIDESNDFLNPGPWRCYVVARVQPKAGAVPGKALTFGIYDEQKKAQIVTVDKNLSDVPGNEYQVVDFGAHELKAGFYLYITPPLRQDIEGVYIDRIVLVRER